MAPPDPEPPLLPPPPLDLEVVVVAGSFDEVVVVEVVVLVGCWVVVGGAPPTLPGATVGAAEVVDVDVNEDEEAERVAHRALARFLLLELFRAAAGAKPSCSVALRTNGAAFAGAESMIGRGAARAVVLKSRANA